MGKASRIAAHTFYNFANILVTSVLSLFVTAIVARMLAPELMGTYSLVTYLMTLAGYLINLGYITTTMRFMAEALGKGEPDTAAGVLGHSVRILIVTGILITVGFAGLAPVLAHFYHNQHLGQYLLLASLGLIPFAMVTLMTAACQGIQRYEQVALNSAICAPLTLVGSIVALKMGWGIPGLILNNVWVYTIGMALYTGFFFRWNASWYRKSPPPTLKARMRRYSVPIFWLLLMDSIVWQRSGVFFLGIYSPPREIAFYSLAFGLATMAMRLVPGTLIGLLIPSMSRSQGAGNLEGTRRIYVKSCQWMAILAIPVAVGGTLLSQKVVELLYGSAYLPASLPLVALLLSGAIVMIYGFPSSSVLYSADGENTMLWIGFSVAVSNVLLALLWIPSLGALGAALANAVSQLLSIVPGLIAVHHRIQQHAPFRMLPKTILAAMLMSLPLLPLLQLPSIIAIPLALIIGPIAYAFGLIFLKALSEEDLDMALELVRGQRLLVRIIGMARPN